MKRLVYKILTFLHRLFPKIFPLMSCYGCLKDDCINRTRGKNKICDGYKRLSDNFDYEEFFKQISKYDIRKHLLTDEELYKYFLDKIDHEKYHICLDYSFLCGEYIDKYNWELFVYKKITDGRGFLTEEYYSNNNRAIVDSTDMSEYRLYSNLYELVKTNGDK